MRSRLENGLSLYHQNDSPEVQPAHQNDHTVHYCAKCGRKYVAKVNALCGVCKFERKARLARGEKAVPIRFRIKKGKPADGTNKHKFGSIAFR